MSDMSFHGDIMHKLGILEGKLESIARLHDDIEAHSVRMDRIETVADEQKIRIDQIDLNQAKMYGKLYGAGAVVGFMSTASVSFIIWLLNHFWR